MNSLKCKCLVGAAAAVALLSAWPGLVPQPGLADAMTGRATVIDGDTIEIRGERIRFHGIDAPESAQWCLDGSDEAYRCGQRAAFALADEIGAGTVTCQTLGRDRYDRSIARCLLGDRDLNGWLVRNGWALAYRQYSIDYVAQEGEAELHGRAMWQGAFDPPWDWRRGTRTVTADGRADLSERGPPTAECAIKGNISGNGRIYHLPGQRHYDRTRISPEKGERWFCSEADAQGAGWRKARV